MAEFRCRECRRPIGLNTTECPHCGAQQGSFVLRATGLNEAFPVTGAIVDGIGSLIGGAISAAKSSKHKDEIEYEDDEHEKEGEDGKALMESDFSGSQREKQQIIKIAVVKIKRDLTAIKQDSLTFQNLMRLKAFCLRAHAKLSKYVNELDEIKDIEYAHALLDEVNSTIKMSLADRLSGNDQVEISLVKEYANKMIQKMEQIQSSEPKLQMLKQESIDEGRRLGEEIKVYEKESKESKDKNPRLEGLFFIILSGLAFYYHKAWYHYIVGIFLALFALAAFGRPSVIKKKEDELARKKLSYDLLIKELKDADDQMAELQVELKSIENGLRAIFSRNDLSDYASTQYDIPTLKYLLSL